MPCQISRATLEDIGDITQLFDAYRQFYGMPAAPDSARHFLGERLRRQESVILLARQENATAVGFTQLYPSFSSISLAPVYVLNDLFVATEARRGGIAKQLLTAARGFASRQGAIRLSLSTQVTNNNAQRLYEQLGWQRDEQFYHYQLSLDASASARLSDSSIHVETS